MVEVIRGWRDLPASQRGAAVAVGAFDGVHRGNQAVIASARAAAQRLGAPLAVVSFDPHPRRLFQPEAAPFRLMTADQMARALAPLGVDRLYLIPFDAEMAGMTDEEFASKTAYRGRIAHGLLSAAFGSAVVGTILPGAGSIYISQTLAFHFPVRIGDSVSISITVMTMRTESPMRTGKWKARV